MWHWPHVSGSRASAPTRRAGRGTRCTSRSSRRRSACRRRGTGAAVADRGVPFQLHQRVRRPLDGAGLVLLGEGDLLGRERRRPAPPPRRARRAGSAGTARTRRRGTAAQLAAVTLSVIVKPLWSSASCPFAGWWQSRQLTPFSRVVAALVLEDDGRGLARMALGALAGRLHQLRAWAAAPRRRGRRRVDDERRDDERGAR